ncbi:hypothetical protein [Cupriavidus pampae]|uniref:Site-specific integrase n=1 Tax=Cupriavidus pampae TaxID=659251 RepID=A0ABN7ZE61_9BURK|nr:hypothetical protein [Cupriavidus pampae]CAG9184254.1 hypothetical protein LMG32289_05569 [Cupriavidus pampae]
MQSVTSFSRSTPTRGLSTVAAYERYYRRHAERLAREQHIENPTPSEIVADLILQRAGMAMSTWRYRKAAVMYVIEHQHPGHHEALEALREHGSGGLARTSGNTAGRKRKHVPLAEWTEIKHVIGRRIKEGYRHAQALLDVLEATLLTGLRPIEWSFSAFATHEESGRPVLRVTNAKHSNGRANGETRELFVDQLTDEERATIGRALAACAAETRDDAERFKLALKHELETCRMMAVAGTRKPASSVTQYSFRHQFIADAKQTFETPLLLSAAVGHASTKTAFEHYGKRKHGRGRVRVFPTPESVAAVQNVTLETYRSYLAAQQGGRIPQVR